MGGDPRSSYGIVARLYRLLQVSYSAHHNKVQDLSLEKFGGPMMSRHTGVFAISVAADMLSMQVQNLRVYERHGLVDPDRTTGGTRLYSHEDLDRLARIRDLLAEGLNLAGIARVLVLESEVLRLQVLNRRLRTRTQPV
jgi:MerR family transcriptional regulator/heat shock protein HspR